MVEVMAGIQKTESEMQDKAELLLHASESRNGYQLSPWFAWFVFLFLVFSSGSMFIVSGKNHDFGEIVVLFGLLYTPILIFGVWFFQHAEFRLTSKDVLWSSTIIPWVWVEQWKEPISNYREIVIEYTHPLYLFWNRIHFRSSHASHPSRIILKSHGPMARVFNQTKFAVFVLVHAYDSSKNISIHRVESYKTILIRGFAENISEKLHLPVRDSNTDEPVRP